MEREGRIIAIEKASKKGWFGGWFSGSKVETEDSNGSEKEDLGLCRYIHFIFSCLGKEKCFSMFFDVSHGGVRFEMCKLNMLPNNLKMYKIIALFKEKWFKYFIHFVIFLYAGSLCFLSLNSEFVLLILKSTICCMWI